MPGVLWCTVGRILQELYKWWTFSSWSFVVLCCIKRGGVIFSWTFCSLFKGFVLAARLHSPWKLISKCWNMNRIRCFFYCYLDFYYCYYYFLSASLCIHFQLCIYTSLNSLLDIEFMKLIGLIDLVWGDAFFPHFIWFLHYQLERDIFCQIEIVWRY